MKTKDKIINAFWQLAKEKTISEITIKDISLKAQINRSTFYNYFLDMADLIEQIENNVVEEIIKSATEQLKDKTINYETIFKLISNIFTNYEEYIYILLIKNNNMGFHAKLKKYFFPIIEQPAKLNTDIKNFDYITTYIFNAILGLITHWYDTGKQMPSEEFVDLMFSLIREGTSKYLK